MVKEVIGMSVEELDRVLVVAATREGAMRQRDAAVRLGLNVRQVKRLVRRHREGGAAALASGHRKGHANNALGAAVRESALGLMRERYGDFGPTLAAEELKELHDIGVSRETLRKWMISDGLWAAGRRKLARVHQGRPRRPRRGELVQVDGSPHRWFEERGVHADRVRRRRDERPRAAAVGGGGDRARLHGDARGAPRPARAHGGALFGPAQRVPRQQPRAGGGADAVHAGAADAGHRADPCRDAAGEGARGAGQPDAPGSAGQGAAAARHLGHGGRQRLPSGVHGGLQPALRGGAPRAGGRAPAGAARRGRAGADPVPAPRAHPVEEPDLPVREPRVPGAPEQAGIHPARGARHGVRGVRRLGDAAAQGPRAAPPRPRGRGPPVPVADGKTVPPLRNAPSKLPQLPSIPLFLNPKGTLLLCTKGDISSLR